MGIRSTKWETFALGAEPIHGTTATGERQIHGGVFIATKAKYNATFTGRGCLIEGRAVYIRIKHRYGHLGILNIYAPNSAIERKEF